MCFCLLTQQNTFCTDLDQTLSAGERKGERERQTDRQRQRETDRYTDRHIDRGGGGGD